MGQNFQENWTRQPIAIIGVGCRFPGASDLDSLWRILRDGIETVSDYPGGRFESLDRFYDRTAGERNGPVTRRGGFLRRLDLFDADFFGISPREAVLLDPQQRLLLEVGWEALDDAGLPLECLAGSRTGVFVGQWTSDFETCVNQLLTQPQLYSTTGSGRYAAAARLAYHFDLRGPNLTLDTACSSSLVAIHLACQSLRLEESELALVGAVNLILRPEITRAYGSAGMLSPDGHCKFGDISANGYVRSEGAAVVVMKLLRRAVADGDPIHAVIRGTASNHEGRSSGMLVSPSCEAQAAMIRAALEDAGISAAEVDYVEAHGTGTAAGDPVELEAIGSVLQESPRLRPCYVGSVKTNLGHCEAAAGLTGLCKLILSLRHASIPATLNFREPNPNISWSRLPLTIAKEHQPWPHNGERRIAALNSFGITGTNAHAIVENAPDRAAIPDQDDRARLFVLSARSPAALEQTASSWLARMRENPSWPSSMADLAYTAAVRRTHHPFRLAAVAKSAPELESHLTSWIEHEAMDLVHGGRIAATAPRIALVFPGQGGQWTAMGSGLFRREPVFRDALTRCDRALRPWTGWSVVEEIQGFSAAAQGDIDRVQPTLFALMIALTELWRSWGVEPGAVVGHSMGEVAAAVVCGALCLDDGAAVIANRSRLMKAAAGRGQMAMTALTFDQATDFIRPFHGSISIAASNSPVSTVLAGDADAMEDAIATLETREIFCRRVQVEVASHCAQMDPIASELERSVDGIAPRQATIPFYSTSTGLIEDGSRLGASYWGRNLREPVLFAGAVQQLLGDGFHSFIEINAHPVLLRAIEECAKHAGNEIVALGSLRRGKDELAEMLGSLGRLYVRGVPVRFRHLYPRGECLRLPAYPWQRERYWPDENRSEGRFARRGSHPHLGAPIDLSEEPGKYLFEVDFSPPADEIQAAGWCIELVMAAACDLFGVPAVTLADIRFLSGIGGSDIGQLILSGHANAFGQAGADCIFRLSAKTEGEWRCCCQGNVLVPGDSGTAPARYRVDRTIESKLHPVTASLQVAAESVGYSIGDRGWSIVSIDRMRGSRAVAGEVVRVGAVVDPIMEKSAFAEAEDASGRRLISVEGVHFEFEPTADCSRDIYEWKWTEIEPPPANGASAGVFLACGDAAESLEISERLRSLGVDCLVAADLDTVRNLLEAAAPSLRGVLWISAYHTAEPVGAFSLIQELRSLVLCLAGRQTSGLRLWLVTTGAHVIAREEDLPSPVDATVWGLARVIASEHPELGCVSLDLSPHPGADEFEELARLVMCLTPEDRLAIRGKRHYGARLERRLDLEKAEVVLRRDGTYLVTGGLGALGMILAGFLAEHGAGTIALVGRRAPNEDARERIARLESRGVRVRTFQADVAEESELAAVLNEIGGAAALRGIFHAAGAAHFALLAESDPERMNDVLRPKLMGAWNLHRLTQGYDLDYWVMYSSIAASCGQPGQGIYAAANAYLDGLAVLRQASGLPAMSIEWGVWKNLGMVRTSGASRGVVAWAEQGMSALNSWDAIDGLQRLMAHPVPVAFVAPVDWNRFARSIAGQVLPAYSGLIEGTAAVPREESGFRKTLSSHAKQERIPALQSFLKTIVAAVLKTQAAKIDPAQPFGSLGMDSLMAVEFASRTTDSLGIRVPVTAAFNFPTLELFTREVLRRIDAEAESTEAAFSAPTTAAKTDVSAAHAAIEAMSEGEALDSLLKAASR